jgi:hypothetical protein
MTVRFIGKATAISCAVITSLSISVARAAEVTILCASGMREVVSELGPQIERATGHRVAVSFGEAGDLRKRIAEQLQPKLKLTRGQRNAEFVAKGEVEIAIQLSNEIRIVPGIEFIPLPAEFARIFVFSAALALDTKEIGAAKAVLQFPSGPEAIAVIRAKGMDEAAPK